MSSIEALIHSGGECVLPVEVNSEGSETSPDLARLGLSPAEAVFDCSYRKLSMTTGTATDT